MSASRRGSRLLARGRYYGEVMLRRERAGAVLTELRHRHAIELPRHAHASAFFCLLLDGAYAESWGRQRVDYVPYTLVYHPQGFAHSDRVGRDGGRFFTVDLGVEAGPAAPVIPRDPVAVWIMLRLLLAQRENETVHAELEAAPLLAELVAVAESLRLPREKSVPAWLVRVRDRLHAGATEPISWPALRAEADVHPAHLSRTFRQFHGVTIAEYQRRLRLVEGCRLLARGVPLARAAIECGFTDQSHFTRCFQRVAGVAPGGFRKRTGGPAGRVA